MESTTQIYLTITPERGAVKDVRGEAMAGGYETRIDITSFDLGFRAKENTVKGAQKPDVVGNLDWDSVTITKVSSKGAEDGSVTQDVECVFKTISVGYKRQMEDGKLDSTQRDFVWDIGKMKSDAPKADLAVKGAS